MDWDAEDKMKFAVLGGIGLFSAGGYFLYRYMWPQKSSKDYWEEARAI